MLLVPKLWVNPAIAQRLLNATSLRVALPDRALVSSAAMVACVAINAPPMSANKLGGRLRPLTKPCSAI